MTGYSDFEVWLVILGLAVGTYAIRYSFLGMVGDRALPPLLARLLRYTAVAVLPALVAPMVVAPAATGGVFDPPRFIAAVLALVIGFWWRNALLTIGAGMGSLFLLRWLLG